MSNTRGDEVGIRTRKLIAGVSVVALAIPIAACGTGDGKNSANASVKASALPQGSERVRLDPADFTTNITNPYWPMKPGSRWVYRGTDTTGTKEKVAVTVTNETKTIANGVKARVIRDVVTEAGQAVEITDDWYAQDRVGNVWYLGVAVRN
jgi:hypothetical protein